MKSDNEVKLPTLKGRLTSVRNAQARGSLRNTNTGRATGLLVSPEWLVDALEVRALELENLIVPYVGVVVGECRVCGMRVEGSAPVEKGLLFVVAIGKKLVQLGPGDFICSECSKIAVWFKGVRRVVQTC